MNYLSFQPAFDVFHTEFRLLRLRRIMGGVERWRYEQLRIIDFYLLFFFRVKDVRLFRKHRFIKSLAGNLAEPRYEILPSDRLIFSRMEKVHDAALGTLLNKGFFKTNDFKREGIERTGLEEPAEIANRIDIMNEREEDVMDALRALIDDYDFLGPSGLKARTGLLEYRYDAV